MSYLVTSHPEIFFTIPRPGGIAHIEPPPDAPGRIGGRGSKSTLRSGKSGRSGRSGRSGKSGPGFDTTSMMSPSGRTTRHFRIHTVVSSSPWVLFDETEEQDNPLPPDPVHDTLTILSITITTIMLMAAKHPDIPRDHYRWALSYLECVKDEFGNAPPNVRGIMNNIKLIDDTLSPFFDKVGEEEPEETSPPEEPAEAPAEEPVEEPPEEMVEEAADEAPPEE